MVNPPIYNEKLLFSRIAQSDEKAFEELFLLYVPLLEPVVRQMVTEKEVIKDILQEVFLYLWVDKEKLTAVEEPRRWIFKIMYNRCYRWARNQALLRKKMASLDLQDKSSTTLDAEEAIGFAETVRILQQAIHQLTPQAKRIYQLHREKGEKINDIAAELGISAQSVKNSLHRSATQIRTYLRDHGILLPSILVGFLTI